MLNGSCLCGAITWRMDKTPGSATACNCTACRRYGALWGYGWDGVDVHLSGKVSAYRRGKALEFLFCPTCGCPCAWRGLRQDDEGRVQLAVNLHLAEPEAVAALPVDHFDGLATFDDLPRDGRCVRDLWF